MRPGVPGKDSVSFPCAVPGRCVPCGEVDSILCDDLNALVGNIVFSEGISGWNDARRMQSFIDFDEAKEDG